MSTAHLICGRVGAGKTTYAKALAGRLPAQRFSIDEWMERLFLMDAPQPLQYQWMFARVMRCQAQILAVSGPLLAAGIPVVLDLGFFEHSQREAVRQALAGMGAESLLHYLDIPTDTRWERVARRNGGGGENRVMEVPRGMFDFSDGLFEDPREEELAGATVIRA